jgi:hypothetical protein
MNHPSASNPNICPDCEQLTGDPAPRTAAEVLGADAGKSDSSEPSERVSITVSSELPQE